jgi:hypothetical protein
MGFWLIKLKEKPSALKYFLSASTYYCFFASRLWIMDYGLWIMDYGLWVMGSRIGRNPLSGSISEFTYLADKRGCQTSSSIRTAKQRLPCLI